MCNTTIPLMVGVAGLVILASVRPNPAQSQDPPSFKKEDVIREDRVASYADSFLQRDLEARQLLSPSNRTLFGQGYRPTIGVPHDPEAKGQRFTEIRSYFIRKLHLDLNAIQPLSRANFQAFLDEVGRQADQTLICAGQIANKYDLNVEGPFNFERELAKVPLGPERERFKRCWLNDAILGTELRMLAWIHRQLFGVPYVNPEKR